MNISIKDIDFFCKLPNGGNKFRCGCFVAILTQEAAHWHTTELSILFSKLPLHLSAFLNSEINSVGNGKFTEN